MEEDVAVQRSGIGCWNVRCGCWLAVKLVISWATGRRRQKRVTKSIPRLGKAGYTIQATS